MWRNSVQGILHEGRSETIKTRVRISDLWSEIRTRGLLNQSTTRLDLCPTPILKPQSVRPAIKDAESAPEFVLVRNNFRCRR
jgi:hypothetical protein